MARTPSNSSLRQRLFAGFMAGSDDINFELYKARKSALLSALRGTVVEIGPGTGLNLRFLDPAVKWIGMEPNPVMHAHILEKAAELGFSVEIRPNTLGESGIPPESVDAVFSTLVLCSVPSISKVLDDVRKVLKPGGRFAFIEHVADRPRTLRRIVQKTVPFTPWRYFSGGCNPGRDIAAIIREAGFSRVECETYMQPGPGIVKNVCRPHISGFAIK
jgi:SAM-dependent methyltransferase